MQKILVFCVELIVILAKKQYNISGFVLVKCKSTYFCRCRPHWRCKNQMK